MDAILSRVNEAVAFLSALEIASLLSGAQKIFSNVWYAIGLALFVMPLYYYVHRFNCEVEEKIGELKGAAFELVRPKEQEPEELQTRGLTPHQSRVLSTAVKRGRRAVLNVTAYNPPPPDGKEPITVSGENILKSMRRFLYTPGTKVYDHALADGR